MNSLKLLTLFSLACMVQACSNNPEPDATGSAAVAASKSLPELAAAAVIEDSTARVFFVSPGDGDTVQSPVTVVFGLEGFEVAPAGTYVERTGHHHLIIDAELPPLEQSIPADERHLHFGLGQTEAVVELAPGKHTLQLVLGDGNHVPHEPPLISEQITITVSGAD